MINLTDNADIHLSSVINENVGMFTDIRLSVTSGGCSGLNFLLIMSPSYTLRV